MVKVAGAVSDVSGSSLTFSAHLAGLSLISFGGIPVILPELHQLIVVTHGWVSDAEFSDFFALSQIVPGPNFVFMLSLIGWKVGGAFWSHWSRARCYWPALRTHLFWLSTVAPLS